MFYSVSLSVYVHKHAFATRHETWTGVWRYRENHLNYIFFMKLTQAVVFFAPIFVRFDSPIKIAFRLAIDKERRTNTSIFIKYSIGSLVTKHFYHLIFKFKWDKALFRQLRSICFNLEQPHKRDCHVVALHLSLCGFEKNLFNQFGERTVSKIYIINSISSSTIHVSHFNFT